MNLIGLLSWFDEPIEALVECLTALAEAGTDHAVAVDGRYALYSADHDQSSANEYAAILLCCRRLGMRCTIHQPNGPWQGGEVEKRTFLFAAGWAVAEPGDWFWVQDADQVVMRAPGDLKQRLEATGHDTAEVEMCDVVALRAQQPDWPPYFAVRSLFRAQPIKLQTNHCTYVAAGGTLLWGYEGDASMAEALDLSDVVLVEHRPDRRSHDRQHAKLAYYQRRDALKVERGTCELCGLKSAGLAPVRWRMTELGPVADWMECCDTHRASVEAVNDIELRKLGVDPASVVAENRNGHAPAPV